MNITKIRFTVRLVKLQSPKTFYLMRVKNAHISTKTVINTRLFLYCSDAMINYKKTNRTYEALVFLAALISGASYASFPLAIVLNPEFAWSGAVSRLGQEGQPYAWLFNNSDTISGLAGLVLAFLLLLKLRNLPLILRYGIVSLLICNVGTLLAAVFSLPPGMGVVEHLSAIKFSDTATALHLLASVINTGGFVAALSLWGLWSYRTLGLGWRVKFVITLLILNILSFGIGQYDMLTGSITQRLFILGYAVWLLIFVNDIRKIRTLGGTRTDRRLPNKEDK